ncbi:MAG: hypothetical protein Kow0092_02830 [Deferrisomatales bacterium]
MQTPLAQQVDFTRYLHLFWKRKWLILLPTVLFPLVAGYRAMQLQDQYKSSTLILVTPQRIPREFIAPAVGSNIGERLHTISQQIFSRTRLEQIIHEFNLFEKARKTRTPEEVIQMMRGRIRLNVHKNDAFSLSYIDANPRLAMLVTNKLASLFIEENLKLREQRAVGTAMFLDDEIRRYQEMMREKQKVINDFKRKYMNELPSQSESNRAMLTQLQTQLQINTQNINAAEDRRVQLQQQIAEIEQRLHEEGDGQASSGGGEASGPAPASAPGGLEPLYSPVLPEDAELAKLKATLEKLRLTYTEKHPDVAQLVARIAKLEQEAEERRVRLVEENLRAKELAAMTPPPQAEEVSEGSRFPPIYEKMKADLLKAEADIARLTAQNEEIQRQIKEYQRRLAATPTRALQLQELSVDYDNINSVLESLINKRLQADLSENLERKQKGEQFRVLDPANLPEKPFSPNRIRYVGMGLMAGLVVGFGFVLLLDLLDFSVKNREDLSRTVDAPVLVVIPEIVTPSDLRRRWMWRIGLSGAAAAALIIAVGVVHLKVKPIPRAVGDLYAQVKATHWTTIR